jgi:hypothetical protein
MSWAQESFVGLSLSGLVLRLLPVRQRAFQIAHVEVSFCVEPKRAKKEAAFATLKIAGENKPSTVQAKSEVAKYEFSRSLIKAHMTTLVRLVFKVWLQQFKLDAENEWKRSLTAIVLASSTFWAVADQKYN